MSKSVVYAIIALSLAMFACLVGYGWTFRWGGPAEVAVHDISEMAMSKVDKTVSLDRGGFDDGVWDDIRPVTVPLLHQVTTAPRGTNLVPELDVRAFHNGTDVYFLFEWKDDVESRTHDVGSFPDAVAVAFSMSETAPASSIMMGFQSVVNIWEWKANLDAQFWAGAVPEPTPSPNDYYTYEDQAKFPSRRGKTLSACQDLLADRPGTVTLKETTSVAGRGEWRDGVWRVIITRSLTTGDADRDAQLSPGALYVAFAVWDGDKGDRGARKSLSDWVIVNMKETQGPASVARAPAGDGFSLMPVAYAQEVEPAVREPRVITIKAKRFEYFPSRITVQKDELITIRLESLDVTHGFYLDGYGVQLKTNPTEVATATFVADKTGRFTFRCSETCGPFHAYMVGFLTVEPNSRFRVFVAGMIGAGAVLAIVFAGAAFKREEKD